MIQSSAQAFSEASSVEIDDWVAPDYSGQIVFSLYRGLIVVPPRRLTMHDLAAEIAARYGLTIGDLRGRSRKPVISGPRQEAFAIIYGQGRHSLPQIGAYFGGRDHTTVLHGIRAHKARQLCEATHGQD